MRARTTIESELKTLKKLEADGEATKGIFLLLDIMDNQQLVVETLLDIRELLSIKKLKEERKKKG